MPWIYFSFVVHMHEHPLLEKVKALQFPLGDYAVFGSGPLLVNGLVEDINDVDLVARGAAWARARSLGPVLVAQKEDPVVRLGDGEIEVFAGWLGMDLDTVIDGAAIIGGLPFAQLKDVLAFKRALGRPNDLRHVLLIEEHMRGRASEQRLQNQ